MNQSANPQIAGVVEGDILAGKFRVERVLGVGGMGVVVAAHHLQLDERVALKFLLPEVLSNPEVVARFEREARAAVKVKSEHVARVMDVGRLPSGSPYMVMEYLEGRDLSAFLAEQGPMPIDQAVGFILQTCEALAEAHALGIVHRDLKPANLFCICASDGLMSIKVIDFGISKVTKIGAGSSEYAMTKQHTIMGSPLYMSPEQLASARDVDARADIWALGVILFELVTGRVPFEGESLPELVARISLNTPPSLGLFRPDAPPGLDGVIVRCLEKDARKRFRNVADLARELLPFAPGHPATAVDRMSRVLRATSAAGPGNADASAAHGAAPSAGTSPSQPPATVGANGPVPPISTSSTWGRTKAGDTGRPPPRSSLAMVGLFTGLLAVGGLSAYVLVPKVLAVAPPASHTEFAAAATTPPAISVPAPAQVPVPVSASTAVNPTVAPIETDAAALSALPLTPVVVTPAKPEAPTVAPASPKPPPSEAAKSTRAAVTSGKPAAKPAHPAVTRDRGDNPF